MTNYWTIQPERQKDIEGSECAEMLTYRPKAGVHEVNGKKIYVFTGTIDRFTKGQRKAAEPLIVELTEDNSLPLIAAQIEEYLTGSDTRCVWLSKGLASQLFRLLVPPIDEP